MRLFWRIFLSVITVTMVVFCISGHLLICAFFASSLKAETELGVRSNISFCRSFESAAVKMYGAEELSEEKVQSFIRSVSISSVQDNVQFLITGQDGETLYKMTDTKIGQNEELLKEAGLDATVYTIEKVGNRYYLNTAGIAVIGENDYFVQNISDISFVYEQKTTQYKIFTGCLGILIIITAAVVFALSMWITLPIRKVAQAAKEIGTGDYGKRIALRGNDEITDLAEEFNRMSERLEESVAELKHAAQRQESFVGSFAHEMKTPLTSIIGYSDMLRSKELTEEERMIYGDYIYQQGKRLENLSHRMLELIVLKRTDFDRKKLSLKKLFLTIREELAPILEERRIRMRMSVAGLQLMAEPELIKTVFLNFIDNSIKAIGTDGEIRILAKQTDEGVLVTVSDNGKGIPQKDLARVTESFYMADRSRKYEDGSVGLGLSICTRILELHQASMKIRSKEGKGTKIEIIFRRSI